MTERPDLVGPPARNQPPAAAAATPLRQTRRPYQQGARLDAEPPSQWLYGVGETAGTLAWGGPRWQVVEFTPGTNYATDPEDYTLADGAPIVDLRELLEVSPHGTYCYRLRPRTSFMPGIDTAMTGTGGAVLSRLGQQVERAKAELAQCYDHILMLSEGAINAWGTAQDIYVGQPENAEQPEFGFLALSRTPISYTDPDTGNSTTKQAWVYQPASNDALRPLFGRLLAVPYFDGSASAPATWSLWNTTFELERWTNAGGVSSNQWTYQSSRYFRSPWTEQCRLKGLSYLHICFSNSYLGCWLDCEGIPRTRAASDTAVELATASAHRTARRYWQGTPRFGFRDLKGRQFTWPGQAAATYTANAAAVRYDFERHFRGVETALIDETAVKAAYTTCQATRQLAGSTSPYANVPASQGGRFARYETHGLIEGTEALDRLGEQLDFAWQGRVLTRHGRAVFRPGSQYFAAVSQGGTRISAVDHLAAYGTAQKTPPLGQRVNTLTGGRIANDRFRGFVAALLPDIETAERGRDGRALVEEVSDKLRFCDGFYRGLYLLTLYATQLSSYRRRLPLTLLPDEAGKLYALLPGDTISFDLLGLPDDAHEWEPLLPGANFCFFWVEDVSWQGDEPTVIGHMRTITSVDPFAPNLRLAVDPDDLTPIALDTTPRTDFEVLPPEAGAITTGVDELQDGTQLNFIEATWVNRWRAEGTELRLTNNADATDQLTFSAGATATDLRQVDLPDATYTAALRHRFPPAAGQTAPQYSDWIEIDAALAVGQDETAPAEPKNVKAIPIPGGLQVAFTAPAEKDYSHTKYTFFGDATFAYESRDNPASFLAGKTGSQTLQVQHVDRSGNASTITSVQVTLTKDGHDEQWIFRRSKVWPPTFSAPTSTDTQRGNDDYVPTDWSRHQLTPLSVYRYVAGSSRSRGPTEAKWSEWDTTLTKVDEKAQDDSVLSCISSMRRRWRPATASCRPICWTETWCWRRSRAGGMSASPMAPPCGSNTASMRPCRRRC